ncbi:MAG: cupin domain-containing protein [Gammaproteobacteria bacterium]|nr:cupin domain-containing protein [Gammaproteobacteria bacterium]
MSADTSAELLLPSEDLSADMSFFDALGFRLNTIYPADNPRVAVMRGHGMSLRLDREYSGPVSAVSLRVSEPEVFSQLIKSKLADLQFDSDGTALTCVAPNGTRVVIQAQDAGLVVPPTVHTLSVRRLIDGDPWIIGRAGMHYRDLIPDRLGGSVIASHIRIPEGGPVPDMVHYHVVGFQLIYCYRGWVRLVYEDQGPPFILRAGDCVTQPPKIRHRVLEASDQLEVIEIGVPAEHVTAIDHELELPTPDVNPEREFDGQTFCHHLLSEARWSSWRVTGFESRDTGVARHSAGVADVQVARPLGSLAENVTHDLRHSADIQFCFVTTGSATLATGGESRELNAGDAFVLPPATEAHLISPSVDLELLEVMLPG